MQFETDSGFNAQEKIARSVVEKTQSVLTDGEWAKIWTNSETNMQAWEMYQFGRYNENQFRKETSQKAIEYYRLALESDQYYAPAMLSMGFCLLDQFRLCWTDDGEKTLSTAERLCKKLLGITDTRAYGLTLLAYIENAKGHHVKACNTMRNALASRMSPSPELLGYYGVLLGYCGENSREIDAYKEALTLTNYPPLWINTNLALAYLIGNHEEAKEHSLLVLSIEKNNLRVNIFLTAIAARDGDLEEARNYAKAVLKLQPDFKAEKWSELKCFRSPDEYWAVVKLLKLSGLE